MKALAFLFICFVMLVWMPVESAWRDFCFNNYDLGIYAQAIELLSFRRPNPWLSTRDIFLFNDHFDPILFVLLPLKNLVPASLLAIRVEMISLLVAACAPIWLWQKSRFSLFQAVAAAALILFSPMTLDAAYYPAHPGTWSLAPLAWMFAFIFTEQFGFALLMLVMTLACKEEYPFVGLMVGILVLRAGHRRFGLAFFGISMIWALLVFIIRPAVLGPASMYTDAVSGLEGLQAIFSGESVSTIVRRLIEITLPLTIVFYGRKNIPWRLVMIPLAALVTMLAIRMAGGYWGNHRAAPLAVCTAFLVAYGLDQGLMTTRRKIFFGFLTFILAFPALELGSRTWRGKPFKKHCSSDVVRLDEINQALAKLRLLSAENVLAQGNLIPPAVDLPGISQVGATKSSKFDYLLIETGEKRSTWPMNKDDFKRLELMWRTDQNVEIVLEGKHVLLLRRKS